MGKTTKTYDVLVQFNNRGDLGSKTVVVKANSASHAQQEAMTLICEELNIHPSVVSARRPTARPKPLYVVRFADQQPDGEFRMVAFVYVDAEDESQAEERGDKLAREKGFRFGQITADIIPPTDPIYAAARKARNLLCELGQWGVFKYAEANRYPEANAMALRPTEAEANRVAAEYNANANYLRTSPRGYVVRKIR